MILLPFIIIQTTLAFFMALHDWVEISPFTHAQALRKQHSWQLIPAFNSYIFASSWWKCEPSTLHALLHLVFALENNSSSCSLLVTKRRIF